MSTQDQRIIQQTYDLAKRAASQGDHPFGALATLDGQVIATARNRVVSENDGTKHAELLLASLLSQKFPRDSIERMTIYCSTEPCTMCAGAFFWIGCRHIVFGCSIHALGRFTTNSFGVAIRDSLSAVLSKIKIEGPLLENEGAEIHGHFWNQFGGKK